MGQRKILIFDPVALTALCDTAKCVLFLVIALATEDKVPYIVVRTILSVRIPEMWIKTLILTFHPQPRHDLVRIEPSHDFAYRHKAPTGDTPITVYSQ